MKVHTLGNGITRIAVLILGVILLASLVSAYTKNYDSGTKTITIKNNQGIEILNLQLIHNTYFCLENCEAMLKIDVLTEGLSSPFSTLRIKKKINNVWQDSSINSLTFQQNNSGSWKELTLNQFNAGLSHHGTYYVKLLGKKNPNEDVDWIPNMFSSLDLNEWAIWSGSNMMGYWDFNTGTGTKVYDSLHDNNLTFNNTPTWQGGILIKSLNFSASDKDSLHNASPIINWNNAITDINSAITLNFWWYLNRTGKQVMPIEIGDYVHVYYDGTYLYFGNDRNVGTGNYWKDTTSYTLTNAWHMITARYNGTGSGGGQIFIDGVPAKTTNLYYTGSWTPVPNYHIHIATDGGYQRYMYGGIDEVGLWNKSLSNSEVLSLYNQGAGLSYGIKQPADITLEYPDGQIIVYNPTYFNASYNSTINGYDLANATYYIWFDNGTIYNNTYSASLSGLVDDSSVPFNFTVTGNYDWNTYVCWGNGAPENCSFASSNASFTFGNFLENSFTFNNITLEGSIETFALNITGDPLVSARLVYNGVSYTGTINRSDVPNYIMTRSILIPQVDEDTNMTFYWSITSSEGTSNSTFKNQTVLNLSIDDCSVNSNTLFNFTLADEETKEILNMGDPEVNGSIELELGISSFGYTDPFLEYAHTYSNGYYATICANVNFTDNAGYRTDLIGRYVADTHVNEFYYIDNGTINSTDIPKEITLYDLLLTDSTTFIFTFTDENNLIVEDAIVHVFRKYIGDGQFYEVERAKEDDNGDTLIHLVEEDVIYYFKVTLNNGLLYTSSQYTAKCLEDPCQISLTAGAITNDFVPPNLLPEGSYSLSTDKDTRLVTLSFNLNESATMNLSIFTLSGNQSKDDDIVNSSSLTAELGSFSVYVPKSFGDITYYAVIYKNGEIVTSQFIDLTPSSRTIFGVLGVFLAILIILLLGLIGATQGVWSIIFLIIGFILASMLTLLEMDYLTLVFYICLCLAIIYKLHTRTSAS